MLVAMIAAGSLCSVAPALPPTAPDSLPDQSAWQAGRGPAEAAWLSERPQWRGAAAMRNETSPALPASVQTAPARLCSGVASNAVRLGRRALTTSSLLSLHCQLTV